MTSRNWTPSASLGRTQQANYVNLSGLYALIFGSKKDAARKFKRWVTHDVLPSIQKTGSYDLRGDSAPLVGTQTPAQCLAQQASQAALAAALPGAEHAQGAYLKVRQELAQINHASQGLRQMRIEVDFHAGLEQPQAAAELPPGLDIRWCNGVTVRRWQGAGYRVTRFLRCA
jgi:hypothetical protein